MNSCEKPVFRINGVWEKVESLPSLVVSWCQAGHHRFAQNGWSGTETSRRVPIQGHICTRLGNGAVLLAFHSSALDHMSLCDELRILDILVYIC